MVGNTIVIIEYSGEGLSEMIEMKILILFELFNNLEMYQKEKFFQKFSKINVILSFTLTHPGCRTHSNLVEKK